MPLELPALDDRRFADLVAEARGLIPAYAPAWTNHNASDPGITLVELFAYLTEILIYRLDRVTTANVAAFLNLLDGGRRTAADLDGRVADEVRAVMQGLRRLDRAVTCSDFEQLAKEADARVERAYCIARRNLIADTDADRPGYVTLLVLPTREAEAAIEDLVHAVHAYLAPRLVLTTRATVMPAVFMDVSVDVTVVPYADRRAADVAAAVAGEVRRFLDPHVGGVDGKGWPFGRNVHASEIYALVDELDAVDHVPDVTLGPAERVVLGNDGKPIAIAVKPHELVRASNVTVQAG